MSFTLPKLPYPNDALKPFLTPETFEYHYGKHHKTYIDKLNTLINDTEFSNMTLEEIMRKSKAAQKNPIFNNAAQGWNHTFFWHCLTPKDKSSLSACPSVEKAINADFGSFEAFKQKFVDGGINQFGSGWVWLVQGSDKKLKICSTGNAENPMTNGDKPILVCDVWEHAYYIDYRNDRKKFLEETVNYINWKFVEENLRHEGVAEMGKLMQ